MGRIGSSAVATGRICVFGDAAKIQRVAVDSNHRGGGYGKLIMLHMIDFARKQQLAPVIALDAQTYALAFYESLGFEAKGDEFDDAGIPHVHMTMKA